MANIKGRVKAPKSAPSGRGRRNSKQSLAGVKNASRATKRSTEKYNFVKRKPGELTELQQVLMKNEGIDFNQCTEKVLRLGKPLSMVTLRRRRKKEESVETPKFVSESGQFIGPRSKKGLEMIDDILTGELMIELGIPTPHKQVEKAIVSTVSNNNEIGISDQNSTGSPISQNAAGNNKSNYNQLLRSKNKTAVRRRETKKPCKLRSSKSTAPSIKTEDKNTLAIKTSSHTKKSNKIKNMTKNNCGTKKTQQKIVKKNLNDKQVKTKQVTLSNGLVLTLAMFQCDYCHKMFSAKASLRRHIYSHLKIEPHPCKKCTKKFRYKMHLQNHINKHHKEMKKIVPMLCQICDKEFLLEENLELHLSTHIKNENSFKCVFCDKQFSYHLLLTQHERQHLLTGEYQCSVCKMSFECRNRLKFHMKSHLKIKDYICQHCGKEFLRMNSLRRHVQICHSGHRLQCPVCKKKLKGHLTEHMRTHKQARPHECDQCGQRFTQSTQLTVHRRCHTGERPFSCKICNRPFTHSNALMLHIRRHTGEKPFQCSVCPLSFSQLPHMKTHLRKIHNQVNPYKCPKCHVFFKLKKQLDLHAKTCTVGERELTFEEKIQASVQYEEVVVETPMTISRMRYLLALLLTMVANKERLKFLGFNKRPIDELLLESIEALGQTPCDDESLTPIVRLKTNIQILLQKTIPPDQLEKFEKEHKTTEEILEILTDDKKKDD